MKHLDGVMIEIATLIFIAAMLFSWIHAALYGSSSGASSRAERYENVR